MELRWAITRWAAIASCLAISMALPASLVDQIKTSEGTKVKRAHPQLNSAEEHPIRDVPYFSKPTAIKRGTNMNLKNPSPDQQLLNEWAQEQSLYQNNPTSLAEIRSSLYNNAGENPFDDKTVAEYEKGFHYGTNKEKIDEAVQNAILKSELYGDSAAINQYRYYGNEERRRRRRRDVKRARLANRMKRETELTPDEIITILTLYENERQNRPWGLDPEPLQSDDSDDEDDWFDAPVSPHMTGQGDVSPPYMFDERPFEKRGRWGAMADRRKRFMVAKKRMDPTRELRYLNGPHKGDFYTLTQLLSNQREPDVPLYHRMVL